MTTTSGTSGRFDRWSRRFSPSFSGRSSSWASTSTFAASAVALAFALGLLLQQLWFDVVEKPLFEDEAVAGLVAGRPLGELLGTVKQVLSALLAIILWPLVLLGVDLHIRG